jgi:aminodeoxyfutalosine deaminase
LRWIRPNGIVLNGELQMGMEVLVSPSYKKGRIQYFEILELRPHTGIPEPHLLSVPFVNAHSHLEYFGIDLHLSGLDYFEWILRLTELKSLQNAEDVRANCHKAAELNFKSGVGWIGEHSDRFGSAVALSEMGIGGWLYQEVLDFYAPEYSRFDEVHSRLQTNSKHFQRASLSPHAPHTVHESTLRKFGREFAPISIHTNESKLENEFFINDEGLIATTRKERGFPSRRNGLGVIEYLDQLGILNRRTQLVHVCDVNIDDIGRIAKSGATVAHCPRSNQTLRCPAAPIRELLDAGVKVGIGLDSPASSGEIDFFEEMRAVELTANARGKPLKAEEILRMSTTMGFHTVGSFYGEYAKERTPIVWDVTPGTTIPLIEIHLPHVRTTEQLIQEGSPDSIQWMT